MLDTTPNQLTVEAETVEDALAEISMELGENAEIMRAQKVHRGGVGGFFAKEMVQLTARRRRGEPVPLHRPIEGGGIADVLERMAQDADAEDSDFRTVLTRELAAGPDDTSGDGFAAAVGWEETVDPADEPMSVEGPANSDATAAVDSGEQTLEPVVVGPALRSSDAVAVVDAGSPAAPPLDVVEPECGDVATAEPIPIEAISAAAELNWEQVEPAATVDQTASAESAAAEEVGDEPEPKEVVDAPPGMGPVDWSTTALLRLGLPGPVISAVTGLDESNDLSWIERIAATVAPHCGPLPSGDVIVVGPHAERLAEPLGLPLVRAGDMAPYDGSFCAMVEDSAEDRKWLEFVRGGRGIHLVVGDEPWQDLLIDEPVAVSWVGESAVSAALYLAFTLGATLGFGTVDGFVSTMVRAQPTDIALAIRRIVGRQ
ncbi:MAG: hypothetical protein QNJ75_06960 [Acidimicrobiia bacterium]|nr:hypothetical protein [Acidimicrobiia bacterium]MDJ0664283.1 hypothetical protein [Acidimicrobiia bacterium]